MAQKRKSHHGDKHISDDEEVSSKMTSLLALVLDTETTGLPQQSSWSCCPYPVPQNIEAYGTSRIVSIAWVIRDLVTQKDVSEKYYVIKPDGFDIPQESTNIHGIRQEFAEKNGECILYVFDKLLEDLKNHDITYIVAHNLAFDIHVIKSELYRYERRDVIAAMKNLSPVCTMRRSKLFMKANKQPKLVELYKYCFPDQDMPYAHNALHDTHHCCDCLQWMFDKHKHQFMSASLWT